MSRLIRCMAVTWLILAVPACGSSPPSIFYALSPEDGPARATPALTVKLHRPSIAGYLDRPEIVKRMADYRLALAESDRWAAPLDQMLERVLAQDLQRRLLGSAVVTDDSAIGVDADVVAAVDVRRLDLDSTGRVVLDAEVSTEPAQEQAHHLVPPHAIHLYEAPQGATMPDLVAAMSRVLGRLADAIALLVVSPPPGG